ncbi:hypothetical protein CCUS01_00574 [Colletotrichum cuscutae]|uniref:Uncharacterized protein n=1 Tax=Colletotrichum cuscutae TaxID=1209917 RepID=A0AAI9Y6Q9_9PEZI|nr:hypothetical protein CCUS01_00574 [Colletotrichum cuscutae]
MGSVFDRKQHRDELPQDLDYFAMTSLNLARRGAHLYPRKNAPLPRRLKFDILPQRSRAIQKPLTLYGGPRSVDNTCE